MNPDQENKRPVLLFFAAWWPQPTSPGSGIFIKEHGRSLLPHFDVHVVHLKVEKDLTIPLYNIDFDHEDVDGLQVHQITVRLRFRRFGLHDRFVRRGYSELLQRLSAEFDFDRYCINVRSHLTQLIPSLPELRDLPFVLIEHFSYYQRTVLQLEPSKRRVETKNIRHWFGDPNLRRVLTVSEDLKETLINHFQVEASKVSLIFNVAHPSFCYSTTTTALEDPLRFICAGIWEAPKRLDLLFDVLCRYVNPQRKLVFDIFGSGSQVDECVLRASSLPPNILVKFHGFQAKEVISSLMRRAHALVHPTDAENAPTVISEAQCCGLPVLSMAVNGIPEMVPSTCGILVTADDEQALNVGLESLIERMEAFDRKAIAQRGNDRYSMSAVGERLSQYILNIGHG
ncbi:MAG: glycosyltransferase family 4 protein [Cryomorphaceae bacterium]